eukprot:2303322-Pyramimonas_sp.AAC.1
MGAASTVAPSGVPPAWWAAAGEPTPAQGLLLAGTVERPMACQARVQECPCAVAIGLGRQRRRALGQHLWGEISDAAHVGLGS